LTMNLYVLVADRHVVRVLRYQPQGALEELVVSCNSDARLREQELLADRSGRVSNGAAGIHQGYAPTTDIAENSLRRWLRQLARGELRSILSGARNGVFLVASGHVLSQLRAELAHRGFPPLLGELPRNFARRSVAELQRRLLPAMQESVRELRWRAVRSPKRHRARLTTLLA
jgi:protein required for attachment to host cells